MNLDFSPEDVAFREEVRTFIAENYPKDLRAKQDSGEPLSKEDYLAWHKVLAKKGWVAPSWPVEHGGTGWTPTQKYIWSEEQARADTLAVLPFGVSMLAPVVYTFGTEEQKAKFLPGIYNGEVWWCQGYSEPGAGSDLASLKTKAERVTGDDGKEYYIVNGQKTWTTLGQFADWGFFLVRTDPDSKPQAGISFLLIDMKSPGIEVRPIITLEGGHEVNDVFLDNVKVPVENRIFHENQGWTCAKALLAHERSGIAGVARSKRGLERLREMATTEMSDLGGPLLSDTFFKRKVAELEIDLTALEFTELRTLAGESSGKGPGPESSILKIKGTEIQQRLQELALEAAGHYGAPFLHNLGHNANIGPSYADGVAGDYFNGRKTSIYGGSNEIQRNIIAKMVLGL
ncbi:MAG: acyl-CoA dehydrogenase family protein [Phenylobacterium sp.]|uniref:acyl-CoA dehydrogenase family protein n=1 Tax=Phenylobacterium sp. TaxID=1871053 RepID=UPI002733A406|nr:acyl-CoA dehydrogenase family protein [Phenylobacterium sp.]MDP1641616.1 acyl-CoA dehydrogenase family protein [Phenylobacterium sp.]MDP3116863.1 acyl-CoA dehydrogenase family protein [Phenylobacterium sp.]MDP3383373.1 acyl-CoA dehydrogenase family protein [Phenylobacterium sp.]